MRIPSSLLRTEVTITRIAATGVGAVAGTPVKARCRWEYVISKSDSTPTDSVRAWFPADTDIRVGDKLTLGNKALTVTNVSEYMGPNGKVAGYEVIA